MRRRNSHTFETAFFATCFMNKLPLCLALVLLPGAALLACATDNGDSVHGPQFGPPPERPDGAADGPGSPAEEGGPGPMPEGGADAPADAPPLTCAAGTVAVLAGGDGALTAAVQVRGGAWTGSAVPGGAAKSAPSLVAFGTGFVGLTRGASDALQSVTYTTSWSAATAVGTNTTIATPALTVVGTKAEGAILAGAPNANKFFRVENTGTSWASAADPIMPPAGAQSFGSSAGTLAAAGADLAFAQAGDDNGLYTQTYDGTWTARAGVNNAGSSTSAPPALLAVDGTFDLVLLYADKTAPNVIGYATRNAGTKAWSSAQVTQATAQTAEQMSVTRISQFVILVTFRGNNQRPYYMTGTLGAGAISWSAPAAMLADTSTVDGAPAVAKGVCGDDAIAVFSSGGQVKATRYRGNAWTVPETVSGASGSRVSVATR